MSEGKFQYYHYDPSLPAAIAFAAVFAVLTAIHCYKLVRSRTWYFSVFVLGGFFEIIGYIGRIISSREAPDFTLGPYLVQTLFILLAPPLFSASIYMTLGRLAEACDGEHLLIVHRRFMTKVFVSGDVLSFFLQAAGGGLIASHNTNTRKTGQNTVVGGLCVQLLFFGCFMLAAVVFQVRAYRKNLTVVHTTLFKKTMFVMYAASLLILIRSAFRTVEYAQGFDGYLLSHEVFIYVLDGAMMIGVMVSYLLAHPSSMVEFRKMTRIPLHNNDEAMYHLNGSGKGSIQAQSHGFGSRETQHVQRGR